jgi:hypothetical protein
MEVADQLAEDREKGDVLPLPIGSYGKRCATKSGDLALQAGNPIP